LRDVSRDLGVRYVLEGSVRKGGTRIRVTAQLIEGGTGNHIWAERYDRELDDIFALQDEITATIVSAIGPEIDQVERDRAQRLPPENLNAWELYQRGLWHLYRFNREDNAEAWRLFGGARDASSNFAPALSGLTHAMYFAFMHGHAEDRSTLLQRAYETGRAAVVTDERDADAHFAFGRILYLRHDLDASTAEFEVAISQNPNFAHAHMGLGTALVFGGHFIRCLESCDQALRLSPKDPLQWTIQTVKGLAFVCMGRNEEAVDALQQGTRQPTAAWTTYCLLASALGHLDDSSRTQAAVDHTLRVKPDLNATHLREIFPFRDPAHFEILIEGLKKAGLKI
jgi:tetratricopeptide (TPR) repeat protein